MHGDGAFGWAEITDQLLLKTPHLPSRPS
jgi:hypothetical protein